MKYPLFNEVNDKTLRTWNRLNTIYNIKEHIGNALSVKYVSKFSKHDKVAILTMAHRVKVEGYENIRREIIRNNNAKA